jgi:hypothetical protein
MGGTNFRTLASMAFEEADMEGCCEVNCSRLPTLSTRCVMNTICWNGILRKEMAKRTSMKHGVLDRSSAPLCVENRGERAQVMSQRCHRLPGSVRRRNERRLGQRDF